MKEFLEEESLYRASSKKGAERRGGVGEYSWLSHSQLSLSSCAARSRLKWPKEALDQLKRKQRVNSSFGPRLPGGLEDWERGCSGVEKVGRRERNTLLMTRCC